jgi:hypothetical protein
MGAMDGPMADASMDDVPEAVEERLTQVKRGLSFDDDWELSLMHFLSGDREIEGWRRISSHGAHRTRE